MIINNDITAAVEKLLESRRSPVIAIDGRCAAGKTTLAKELARHFGLGIVSMDDFFLPFDMRTAERLSEPGGNVHRERFADEVLPHLGKAESFSYRVFDCSAGTLNGTRTVSGGGVIVEGSYSMHSAFADAYDMTIFMDIDPKLQQERIISRNGEQWWVMFRDRWIPMEEKYHSAFDIRSCADLIIEAQ